MEVLLQSGASFKLARRVFKPSQHADSKQDLKARSHPWRLPRVSVPFAGSEHHKAALPAHAVHAVLSRRHQLGLKDSSFNADACEQCRYTPCTKTRHGSTLMEHFTSSKQLVVAPVPAARTEKRGKDASRPRSVGPSAGSAGDAGAEKRVCRRRGQSRRRGRWRRQSGGGREVASLSSLEGKFVVRASSCRSARRAHVCLMLCMPQCELPTLAWGSSRVI